MSKHFCAMRARVRAAAIAAIGLLPLLAAAIPQDPVDPEPPTSSFSYLEDGTPVRSGEVIRALGPDLMGDLINESVGSLEFNQTDLSIPGNSKLDVRVGRRIVASTKQVFNRTGLFGDWDLDIPHLHTIATATEPNWYGGNSKTNFNRCSEFNEPPSHTLSVSGGPPQLYFSYSFWDGYQLYVPGQGDQTLIKRMASNTNIPSGGAAYPAVTNKNWVIRCFPSIDNGVGEGFEAISPDGVTYRFNHMAVRPHAPVRVRATTGATPSISRVQVWFLPTQITDRFGNWVRYAYTGTDGWRVSSITASDGRAISIAYNGVGNRIQSITDGTVSNGVITPGSRTWTYAYGGTYTSLQTVTLPDQSQWRFSLDEAQLLDPRSAGDPMCDSDNWEVLPVSSMSVTHPSGALGTFTLQRTIHARTDIPVTGSSYCHPYNKVPRYFSVRSLKVKTLSGPGMAPQSWTYAYSAPEGVMAPCNGCVNFKTVTITDPEGNVTANVYGTQFGDNEGLLLGSREGVSGSSSLRSTSYAYASRTTGPYPSALGTAMVPSNSMSNHYSPQSQVTIVQQGVTFSKVVTSFDVFARPLGHVRSNSLGTSRSEATSYYDHTGLWVLGQIASRTVDQKVPVSRTFDATNATVRTLTKFGKLEVTYTFSSDGTLYRSTDALNKSTTFSAYKRGMPQQVAFADGTTISAVVNNFGSINSFTNEAGSTWSFQYDPMGRLARKTPPATGEHPTVLWFVPVTTAEYGLAANHWRQTIMTGNAVTNHYFDARWRKRLTVTYDNSDISGTQRMQRFDYDSDNRTTFASYPARSITSIDAVVPGTTTTYDALGRVTRTQASSELGVLTSATEYLSGFQRRVTDARNQVTTTAFQTFDQPEESAVATINAPEGLNVVITRDALGKPLSITRSGNYGGSPVSATRRYVYDGFQRLCKTIEPETGATIQQLDSANNITWRATGLNLLNPATCDTASVPDASKVAHTYDARHRITGTGFGDGSPSIGRSYTLDGLPLTVVSDGSTWTYDYTPRRLLKTETLTYSGSTFIIGRTYDLYGNLSQVTYPDTSAVALNPNALGEPRQVGAFASGVTYHPNGAVAGYTLGNGIVHSVSLNARGLPYVVRDAGVMQDQYGYDASGNLTSITDQQEGIATRSMGYDGLDRLTAANSPNVWGNGSFTYDSLGNLRTSVVGGRSSTHTYGTNNLLSGVTTNGVATSYAFDARGNLSTRGGQSYTFDMGNRLGAVNGVGSYAYDGLGRRISATGGGVLRSQVYSQDGQLLFGESQQGTNSWNTRYIYLGGKLIAEVDSKLGVRYTHTDSLGSPVAITNGAGQLLSRTRYEPYGKTAAGTNPGVGAVSTMGFSGHVNDAESGLVYMQQRYYDPLAGRFLSVDPVVTNADTGKNFNRYEYALNNPYKFVDPNGRDAIINVLPSGNLNIKIPISFSGPGATKSNIEAIKTDIKNTWSKNYMLKGVERAVSVEVVDGPSEGVNNTIKLTTGATSRKDGASYVAGGNSGEWNVDSPGMTGGSHEAAHEAGHLMGDTDYYKESVGPKGERVTKEEPGYENNVMGTTAPAAKSDSRNMDVILKSPQNKWNKLDETPKWFGRLS